jgi:hypothetical protein
VFGSSANGRTAAIPLGARSALDPLPEADVVLFAWSDGDAAGLDRVFLNGPANDAGGLAYKTRWQPYACADRGDAAPGPSGWFGFVRVFDRSGRPWRVLLFRTERTLVAPPWAAGLASLLRAVLADARPDRIVSTGAVVSTHAGLQADDVVVGNCALLELQRSENGDEPGNGSIFRCRSWFPAQSLFPELERARNLSVALLEDVPALSSDLALRFAAPANEEYAYIDAGDALLAREAEAHGVRYAFVRGIAGPAASYNSALAAWSALAGDGSAGYAPPRATAAPFPDDPLEVKLAFQVRACGSCNFFWPAERSAQRYGPYTAYDFELDAPATTAYVSGAASSPWIAGRTRPPAFPEAEVADGCRKAPIMTLGINPNLTAFAPGQTGAAWCYPSFSSDGASDEWAKYAWYYRYRTLYQERLDLDFARRYVLPEGRVYAARSGRVTAAVRADDSAAWTLQIRYDGDPADSVVALPGANGDFPYVSLFDALPPNDTFRAGDLLAGRLAVPGGIAVEIRQAPQTYYQQFAPVLARLQATLRQSGHPEAELQIGEDVSQLDMVACASPHWKPGFLGGSAVSLDTVVENCVERHAWALKQIVQSRPAVLYVVSQASWNMFRSAFGTHVRRDPPFSRAPVDNDFSLLRESTDPAHPAYFRVQLELDGLTYECETRLVITPHFSYPAFFLPQFRVSPNDWAEIVQAFPEAAVALTPANGFTVVPPDPSAATGYLAIQLPADPAQRDAALARLRRDAPDLYARLQPGFIDAHAAMADVLDELYAAGRLGYIDGPEGCGHLARTAGACSFCTNARWRLPLGCAYGKDRETQPPPGFLERVARAIVATAERGPS